MSQNSGQCSWLTERANRFYLEEKVKVPWFAPRWRNLFNLTMHFLGNMGRGHTLAVQIKIQFDWKSHSRINDLHTFTTAFILRYHCNFCCHMQKIFVRRLLLWNGMPFWNLESAFPVCVLNGWWWHGGGDGGHVAQGEMSPAGHVRHSGENDEDGEIPRWFLS